MEGFAVRCRQCNESFELSARDPHEVSLWGSCEEFMLLAFQCHRCSNVVQFELPYSREQGIALRSLSAAGGMTRVPEHLTGQCWCGSVHTQQRLQEPQLSPPRLTRKDLVVHEGRKPK